LLFPLAKIEGPKATGIADAVQTEAAVENRGTLEPLRVRNHRLVALRRGP
jgi:hypothetical protein